MLGRAHIKFTGRVQGVFFRANTQRIAIELNLTGWVRNMYDGSVEAKVEGEKENIELLIFKCRKEIPSARVTNVEIKWEEHKGEWKNFSVR